MSNAFVKAAPSEENNRWLDLMPLKNELLPVPDFNYDLLPDEISDWVRDISERVQCPSEFVAVTAMVSLAAVLGRKATIHPKRYDDWTVVPNLWGALVGRPSVMKTPAMAEGLRPLKRLAIVARKEFQENDAQYKADTLIDELSAEALKAELKKAIRAKKVVDINTAKLEYAKAQEVNSLPPTERRYIINDATVEKLGELLNQNPNGLLLERDELIGWFRNLDREDRANDRSFFIEAFNGSGTYTYDRIGRGTTHIESNTLSLIGGIQPARLRPYVWSAINQGSGDDGLIQRFQLLVYPDDTGAWRNVDRWPDGAAKDRAFKLFQRLDDLPMQSPNEEGRIPGVRFDDEGQAVFDKWRCELEAKVRQPDIHPAIESHLVKYRSLMPSLALIINECAVGHLRPVTRESAVMAAAWCQFLEAHALRIYGAAINPTVQNAITILERRDKLEKTFKPREIQQKGWAGLAELAYIKAAIGELIDSGHLAENIKQNEAGGRPSLSYSWNPLLDGSREKL